MVTGVIGGLGAILFRKMIYWISDGFHFIFLSSGGSGTHWTSVLAPALGLLLVSLISHYLAREVKGHGVPQILESLALRGGRIRPRVGMLGIVASAMTIGSGGSVGREGPIALIGASFGSSLGQLLRMNAEDISLLLACGSAAGIGATFNAPIAGGFFGLEVILGTYSIGALVPVFLASVTGVTVFTALMGGGAVLQTPPYHVINHFALLFMLGLGMLMAVVAHLYTRGLTISEDLLDRIRGPFWAKSLFGGLVVGIIGYYVPEVLGVGYLSMHRALAGQLGLGLLVLLFVAKYVATLITIASGGSGGVFAPSLFIGGMFGGIYGSSLHLLSPSLAPHPAIYVVAGMAAMFSAAAQAPFVGITILLEVTGDYHLTAPVMAAAAISYWIYGHFSRYSMYTVKLSRKGIVILRGNDVRPVDHILVSEALEPIKEWGMPWTVSVAEGYDRVTRSHLMALIVLDEEERVVGQVTLASLVQLLSQPDRSLKEVEKAISSLPKPISMQKSLDDALRRFALDDVDIIPVSNFRGKIVGIIRRPQVLRLYNSATLHSLAGSRKGEDRSIQESGQFIEWKVTNTSPFVDATLAEISLPDAALIVSIVRNGGSIIPHGATRIEAGDTLLLFVSPVDQVDSVRAALSSTSPSSSLVRAD